MSESTAEETDPARGFAQMLGKAKDMAEQAQTEEAPYGYTTDPDGTVRPKKAPGRPRKSPSLDELKEQRAESVSDTESPTREDDRAPDEKASRRRGKPAPDDAKGKDYPQFREGVIEKGVNRLYRKAGKMVRVWDASVGQALIDITRAEDADDITVGKAWEEIARTNPRIRKFLLKIIKGGNWGTLIMAHAPVFLALFIKFKLGDKLPMGNFLEAFLDDGDGEAPAQGSPLEGLQMGDMAQMGDLMNQAMAMAGQALARQQRSAGDSPRQAEVIPDMSALGQMAEAVAAKAAANGQPPPAFTRHQPKRTTRAKRAR